MTKDEWALRINDLEACDPDYVCDVLGVSSVELILAFPEKVDAYIQEDWE